MFIKPTLITLLIYYASFAKGDLPGFGSLGKPAGSLPGVGNLGNLGEMINKEVQSSLRPLSSLDTLGDQISSSVKEQLAPLDNLGEEITRRVEEGLEPVRIMESIMKVRAGTDGTTTATYQPSGTRVTIRDGYYYKCEGKISDSDGTCDGTLTRLNFAKKEDFCYVFPQTVINNWYCMTVGGGFKRISSINGQVICEADPEVPSLMIKEEDYRKMCQNIGQSVFYKYFTNSALTSVGNGLQCTGSNPQVCTYSENKGASSVNIVTG